MRQLPVLTTKQPGEQAIDPVCGMTVSIETAAASFEHEGRKYYFCRPQCRDRFRESPQQFINGSSPAAVPVVSNGSAEYTCPMHPEVIRNAPGSCPICGMALESRTVSAADEPNPELE